MSAKSDAAETAAGPPEPPAPLLMVLAAAVHAKAGPAHKAAIEASLKHHHGHDVAALAAPDEEKHDAVSGHPGGQRR